MRPRYLEIEGLQSFQDVQKIDFDKLSETGLFGIFGPTGSGKSTVLDAITLALYGKVHRAVSGTQGIINTNRNIVKVSFAFDILKDNIRKSYKVERVYGKKKGSENSCEVKIARLMEITEAGDIPIVDKSGEVSAKVEELLGLKHDDFTRAVVLPQNKFQDFLLLEKAKKREMLERIFYLEEYGRQLTEKVSNKIYLVKDKLSKVQGALSMLGDASDKALEDAGQSLKASETLKERTQEDFKLIETQFNEAKEVWKLVDELNFVTLKVQEHLTGFDEITGKKYLLERAKNADSLIDFIKNYNETSKSLTDTNIQLGAVYTKLPQLEKLLNEARNNFDIMAKEAETVRPKLIEQKTNLNSALIIKKEIEDIFKKMNDLRDNYKILKEKLVAKDKEIEKGKADINNTEESISACKSKIDELKVDVEYRKEIQKGVRLEDELKAADQSKMMYQSKFNELSGKVSELEKKLGDVTAQVSLSKANLDSLILEKSKHEELKPGDRSEINLGIENYHKLNMLHSSLKSRKEEMNSISIRVINAKTLLENQKMNLQKAQEISSNIQTDKNKCSQEVERIKKLIEKNDAYMLAKNLKEGDRCPVCGSAHHPNPASEWVSEEVDGLEQKLKDAEAKLAEKESLFRNVENNCIALAEQIRNIEVQIAQLTEDYGIKEKEYNQIIIMLPQEMQVLGFDRLGTEIEKLNKQSEEKLKAIEEWESRLENLKNDILKTNEKLLGKKAEENGSRTELQVNKENLHQIENSLNEANKVYTEKNKLYMVFLNEYKIQSASVEFMRMNENDRLVESIQKQMEKQQDLIRSLRAKLDEFQNERQQLGNKFAEIENEGKNLKEQKDEKEGKVKELSGDCGIESEIRLIEEKLFNLGQQEKIMSENVKKIEEQFNNLNMQKNTLENQRKIYSESLDSEKSRLENIIREKGFDNNEEVEKSILSKEQQKLLNEEIEKYDKTERNLQAHKNMILKKLDKRNITEEEWNKISSGYAEKASEKDESTSLYEVAKNIYITTKGRHDKWTVLSKEFNELSRKSDMLDQIKTLLKGNGFIEYIAEERLRYIAKEASETLGVMTKFRYALELDSESGFVICDNSNGGVHRMVTSLSGGETFMTSLSLALALSKQIQLKGQSPLEFFFLDEGFGTLDGNLLDTVIDSLERLSTKERVIGLISHVPELRNRIARRLVVDPPTSDGIGSMVRIEKG